MKIDRKRINLFDIARVAGVSAAAVAKAVDGRADLPEARRERIQGAIKDLGYRPDKFALHLARERKGAIAFAAPIGPRQYLALFESGVLEGVALSAAMKGWDLHYVLVPPRGRFPTKDHAETVDATIVFDFAVESQALRSLLESDHPCVLLNRRDENFPSVAVDNRLGGRKAVEHLLGLGHRAIAVVWSGSEVGDDRMDGAREAFAAAGVEPLAVVDADWDREKARQAIRRYLVGPRRATAVFAFSDWMAWGVLAAAAEANLAVPRDLSLIGFDDALVAEAATPPLTTVRQPLRRLGETAVDLLSELLGDQPVTSYHRKVAPEVVVRASTARPGR